VLTLYTVCMLYVKVILIYLSLASSWNMGGDNDQDNNTDISTEPHRISRVQFLKFLSAGAIVLTLGGLGGFASIRRIFASTSTASVGTSGVSAASRKGESASIKISSAPFNEELSGKSASESASIKISSAPFNEELSGKSASESASIKISSAPFNEELSGPSKRSRKIK
jgi:hypothetical protein